MIFFVKKRHKITFPLKAVQTFPELEKIKHNELMRVIALSFGMLKKEI